MEMPRMDEFPKSSTALYRPSDGAGGRPAVELVARSAPVSENELVPLLRRRLRFLLIIFAVFYSLISLLHLYNDLLGATDCWASLATSVVCFGLAAILSSRPGLTLRQLRGIELLLVAVFAARMFLRGYILFWSADHVNRVHDWIAAGEGENARQMLTGLAHRLTAPCAMFVVAYGVIIPNTWRRCALVVAVFTFAPIMIWIAACTARGLPTSYWLPFAGVVAFLVLIQTALLAVYGAYRIESSRQEAAEARRLGQYVLREKIGSGGMGEVYRADHLLLRRPCAIKLIRPERANDPRLLQRFEREVQATATLTHPNAVQVFDYGRAEDGTFYYVMEYLPGLTLEQLVERHGPLPQARAVQFLRQICGALGEAHGIGLLHRDIKPGNVMVCTRGGVPDTAKLLDFGLVLPQGGGADGDKLTQDGAVAGTPAYMSPEQAGGQDNLDARSDIYSVGALAYFLLTGQPPFAGRSNVKILAAHLYEPPAPLTAHRPEVPPELETIILRCLAKNPAERFPDVMSVETALAACDTVREWTAEDAAEWWQRQSASEARTGSSQGHEEAGRTS